MVAIVVTLVARVGYGQQGTKGQQQPISPTDATSERPVQGQQPVQDQTVQPGNGPLPGRALPDKPSQDKQAANPGEVKLETAQETNQKIERLAALARARPLDTRIGPGDLLHFDVFDVPELSRDVRVSIAGELGFPLIPGKIPAAGLTAFQLEEKIEELLVSNGLVSHPQVSVFVKEQLSQPITVVGAVGHPLVYQVQRPLTLLEVLSEAGGIADTAGGYVTITRPKRPGATAVAAATEAAAKGNDTSIVTTDPNAEIQEENSLDVNTITIRLRDLLETGNPAFNIPVFGGDVVRVPRAGVIYALGFGISQPGGYVIQEHGEAMTVLKLLALAHGLTGFAKADSAVIMRNNSITGKRDVIPVKLKQMENRKADDVAMQNDDILYVPDSAGKKALARTGEAAVAITTGIVLYRAASGGI